MTSVVTKCASFGSALGPASTSETATLIGLGAASSSPASNQIEGYAAIVDPDRWTAASSFGPWRVRFWTTNPAMAKTSIES